MQFLCLLFFTQPVNCFAGPSIELIAYDLSGNGQHQAGANLLAEVAAEALPCRLKHLVASLAR